MRPVSQGIPDGTWKDPKISYAEFYDFAPIGFVTFDVRGVIREINLTGAEMFGRERSLLLNTPLISHFIKSDRKKILYHLARCKQSDGKVVSTISVTMERGNFFRLQFQSILVPDSLRNGPLFLTALMDFNEVADIRSLAEELARTEEKVRSSIANELRERILGFITMSRQRLDKFADSIELPEQLATIDMIRESIDISARRIESLARQICPTELYETSLESALCSLVEMVREEQNVPAVFKSDMTPIQVAEETRAIIFQVVRELLGNAARHAHAKRIVISLSLKKGNVVIKIEDNGIGFDADMIISANGKAGNFGILNARRRLEHIGGVVQVDTAPGCGTCITLLAPFKERIVESGGKRFANGCNAVQERPDSSRFDSVSVSYPAK